MFSSLFALTAWLGLKTAWATVCHPLPSQQTNVDALLHCAHLTCSHVINYPYLVKLHDNDPKYAFNGRRGKSAKLRAEVVRSHVFILWRISPVCTSFYYWMLSILNGPVSLLTRCCTLAFFIMMLTPNSYARVIFKYGLDFADFTQCCYWHRGVKLSGIIETGESDSALSMTLLCKI